MASLPKPPAKILARLREGVVIPAHPLALNRSRKLDEKRQQALTRYYCDAGAGGVAVGVHTTQFAIRLPEIGLYKPVLVLAKETLDAREKTAPQQPLIRVAGIAGQTQQAVVEAQIAAELGYHLGLVSLSALQNASNDELLTHLKHISQHIAIMGFYLQPSVGGRRLDYAFWRRAAEIENFLAVKIAPFNRYSSLDVVRAIADSGRSNEISLYTGNDDNIVVDLLSTFSFTDGKASPKLRFTGGLLGHWAFWTHKAVEQLEDIKQILTKEQPIPQRWLNLAQQITDVNQAVFDFHHQFRGCIPGIHEILRKQGLLENLLTLDQDEKLSSGQLAEIDRVYEAYPHLNDDHFVEENLHHWLK